MRVTDRGYLLGEGVFATMRGYGGVCFASDRHLATFARGAAMFGLPIPMSLSELADLADDAASKSGAAEAYVRVTLARGHDDDAVLSIVSKAFDVPPPAAYAGGIDVVTVSLRRVPPECGDPTVKSTSYGREVLGRREVAAKNAGEGIVFAGDGSVAGGTMATLFLGRGGELLTPSLATGCRDGVTRRTILGLAERAGLRAREELIAPSALLEADEVFFASTRVECLPVARIDGRATTGRFEHTRALHALLQQTIASETAARRAGRANAKERRSS